ncbi:MAG TPA: alpha/beta hydrolase [Solirubrobacteraceae bacterium]|nr:alpha/beta hydrolase [Solirubrobacteraceae bacterium]
MHGLRALAGAQSSLPKTSTTLLAGGPVEYVRAGDGKPAVVLIAGFGMPIEGWALVLPQLAQISTVLAYNRRGCGASAEPQQSQTGAVVVDTLRELLDAAAVVPPYVLVGHGLGGLHANLLARRFPHEVAGVVLLEPVHPDDDFDERRLRFLPRSYRPGASRRGTRRHHELHFLAETAREIEQAGPFPDVPLTVVSGSRTPPRLTTSPQQASRHAARQRQLVALSARGTHVFAPATGQFPQVTDPEIVVGAVREVVAGVR